MSFRRKKKNAAQKPRWRWRRKRKHTTANLTLRTPLVKHYYFCKEMPLKKAYNDS